MSDKLLVLLSAAFLLLPGSSQALSWELPLGTYSRLAPKGELRRVESLPGKRLKLIFAPGEQMALVVLDASYKMTAQKFSDYHVTATVKSASKGKRAVNRVDRMGISMGLGQKLRFTTSFHCVSGHQQLQICLHDKLDGKVHVVCQKLSDKSSSCTPPPTRPPGHMINPPPNRGLVNTEKAEGLGPKSDLH